MVEMASLDGSLVCPIHPQPERGGGLRKSFVLDPEWHDRRLRQRSGMTPELAGPDAAGLRGCRCGWRVPLLKLVRAGAHPSPKPGA
jgi:hypothetical protein